MTLRSALADTDPQTQQSLAGAIEVPAKPEPRDRPWWQRPVTWLVACGGAAGILLLATIVFLLQTKDGVIRVEIQDPEIEVSIKGTDIVLKHADNGQDVRLSPGDHTLIVQRGELQFETDELTLRRGDTVVVHVEYLDGAVEVREGEQVIGHAEALAEAIADAESSRQLGTDPQPAGPAVATPEVDLLAAIELSRDASYCTVQPRNGQYALTARPLGETGEPQKNGIALLSVSGKR